MKSEEKNYQKDYCNKYFGRDNWAQEQLNQVDVLLRGRRGQTLLYLEFKFVITTEVALRRALAQTVLTNKKQEQVLDHVGLCYRDGEGNDVLQLIDCTDDNVMYNNAVNWKAETPSNPSADAVERICEQLQGRVTPYENEDIALLYQTMRHDGGTEILITERNVITVYNQWRAAVTFVHPVQDEQESINLFLIDLLNGTKYRRKVTQEVHQPTLFGREKVGEQQVETDAPLLREGTDLSKYELEHMGGKIRIVYDERLIHTIANTEAYDAFWRKYHRPPEYNQFLGILEHSSALYTEKYRRDTGGEYTPTCFVDLQNELLARYGYNMDEYIVCDPCAGVGNLENQFGRDYKPYCYLSTLEQMDVDICRIKGFENTVRYDYLASPTEQPRWKYKGVLLGIDEIARREHRKLMVVMNPPYTRQSGFRHDLAIEFFIKAARLEPDAMVYYCKTEFFLRPGVAVFKDSGYRVVSHVFSNAKTTFRLSNWMVSQVILDRSKGRALNPLHVTVSRYEVERRSGRLAYVGDYTYDNERPKLVEQIEQQIKEHATGMRLGQWTSQSYCLVLSDRTDSNRALTTDNLKWALLLKGINFNTHGKYFETSNLTYRGGADEIPAELFNDGIMFSLFYKGMNFTNRDRKNCFMPFRAEELGCAQNDLYVKFAPQGAEGPGLFEAAGSQPFDFRVFLSQFSFSDEAWALRRAALEVFRYYHRSPLYAAGRDWNDSFYDITNAIMGKDPATFRSLQGDSRITQVKTTRGTRGFGRHSVADFVPRESLPLFQEFFDRRDALARKINRELLAAHLLLWERENIY